MRALGRILVVVGLLVMAAAVTLPNPVPGVLLGALLELGAVTCLETAEGR